MPVPNRIIPAYAGSTAPFGNPSNPLPDHPRIRGEHQLTETSSPYFLGSSPHTRGARRLRGETHDRRTDHPRIRGEHDCGVMVIAGTDGSSPHTRGAPPYPSDWRRRLRIIPAYAGSTRSCRARPARCRDHPRIRGEHVYVAVSSSPNEGSSPHTRGAQLALLPTGARAGIIPAYAGSTAPIVRDANICADHPRIRGEHNGLTNGLPSP